MLNTVQLVCCKAGRAGHLSVVFSPAKSGQPSGLRHAGTTNNVTILGGVRQSGRERRDCLSLVVCKLLTGKKMLECAARVTPRTECGTRRANYMAVPPQGYGRN